MVVRVVCVVLDNGAVVSRIQCGFSPIDGRGPQLGLKMDIRESGTPKPAADKVFTNIPWPPPLRLRLPPPPPADTKSQQPNNNNNPTTPTITILASSYAGRR